MWDFAQVTVVVTRVMVLMLLVLVALMLHMLGSVGAVGPSLVPQVGKLEVALTLERYNKNCVSLGPIGSWVPGLLARRPGLNPVGLSFSRGRGLEVLARRGLGEQNFKEQGAGPLEYT
ncbi:unnamed protein product [Prunus armeniaca]